MTASQARGFARRLELLEVKVAQAEKLLEHPALAPAVELAECLGTEFAHLLREAARCYATPSHSPVADFERDLADFDLPFDDPDERAPFPRALEALIRPHYAPSPPSKPQRPTMRSSKSSEGAMGFLAGPWTMEPPSPKPKPRRSAASGIRAEDAVRIAAGVLTIRLRLERAVDSLDRDAMDDLVLLSALEVADEACAPHRAGLLVLDRAQVEALLRLGDLLDPRQWWGIHALSFAAASDEELEEWMQDVRREER
jgi:hypothetical protein